MANKKIEVSEQVSDSLDEWLEDDYDEVDRLILDALDALDEVKRFEGNALGFVHSQYEATVRGVLLDTTKAIDSEVGRLRRLRLGERVTQMEDIQRTTVAHIEVVAGGMVRLLTPWWRRRREK